MINVRTAVMAISFFHYFLIDRRILCIVAFRPAVSFHIYGIYYSLTGYPAFIRSRIGNCYFLLMSSWRNTAAGSSFIHMKCKGKPIRSIRIICVFKRIVFV